jgi:signal recognition particle subunit SEC65
MEKLSKRDLVDIEEIASELEFKPIKKKKLKYPKVSFENLEPLTYTIAKEEQEVETHTDDGKETTNVAKKGDFIFSGPSGELYVLKPSKVKQMYDGEIGGTLSPEQTPRQVAKYSGKQIEFMAPWDEPMVMKPGDYLVKEQDGSGYYRIAKKEFEETYEKYGG